MWYCRWGNHETGGITVCNEWKSNFLNFYNWAVANGYDDSLSIDRIKNSGNYEPTNCQWITQKEQCSNKRSNRMITVNGITKTQQQWAETIGIGYDSIIRARNRGRNIEKYIEERLSSTVNL